MYKKVNIRQCYTTKEKHNNDTKDKVGNDVNNISTGD